MADLTKLSDADLDAEHDKRMEAIKDAKAAYSKDGGDKLGRALLKARERAGETQAEVNARRGAPPAQSLT